ncbi:MAG: hypothetical protein AAB347_04810 [Bacteroidota bacterium]
MDRRDVIEKEGRGNGKSSDNSFGFVIYLSNLRINVEEFCFEVFIQSNYSVTI